MARMPQRARVGAALAPTLLVLAAAAPVAHGQTAPVSPQTTVRAEADGFVDSSRPKRSYGGNARLRVAESSPVLRSYLRFNVTGLQGTVQRAVLRIRVDAGSSRGFDVRGVGTTKWSESSLTYATAPALSPTLTGRSGALSPGAWVTVDVTPLVKGNGSVSMALTRSTVTAFSARSRIGPRRRATTRRSRTRRSRSRPRARRRVLARAAETAVSLYSRETGTSGPQLIVETAAPADVTPPQVALTAPTDGETVTGLVPVTATASDDRGVARVEFRVDGATVATDTTAPYTMDWDTEAVAEGTHTLTALAADTSGNLAPAPSKTVNVVRKVSTPEPPPPDAKPPETTIASGPADTHRSGVAQFAFTSNETGVTFQCSLDGAAFAPCSSGALRHVMNGRHELRVRARDAAGNLDATPDVRVWWADALLQNGLFEAPATGWSEYGFTVAGWKGTASKVTILSGGLAGMKARVEPLPGADFYSLYDAPRSVDATVAGRTYTARGYVRSDAPGKRVCLDVIERSATGIAGTASRCVTTTTSWQLIPDVPLVAKGGNTLYTSTSQDGAATGDSFEVDGLELSDGTPLSIPRPQDPAGDPRLLAFGDLAFCDSSGDEAVSRLLDTQPGTIAMVGDVEQHNASASEFTGCFHPTFNRHLWRTRPAVGDHEYRQPGAAPYWEALGGIAGPAGKGWYSYDLGSWHIVVLNSNCGQVGGCGPGSEQYAWLEQDLAAHPSSCIGAYFHHPRWSSGNIHGSLDHVAPFWDVLYQHGAEWVLGGNDANYQRFAPQTPDGDLDAARGIRQFVVGTGGTMHYAVGAALPNTEVQHSGTFGALQLTLGASGYSWKFLAQEGRTFTDAGTHACSARPQPDTTPPTVRLTEPAAGATLSQTARVAAEAADNVAVDQVEFRAGTRVLATDRTAPYAADVDLTPLAAGTHALTAVARDAAGNTTTSAAVSVTVTVPPPAPNLVANPGFETSLSGWGGYRATVTRVAGGAVGSWSMRVAYSTTGSSYSAITTPVTSTTAGRLYRATASVRSQTPGRRVCLRLRETGSAGALGAAETCVTTTSSWASFPLVGYTAAGGGSLDLYAYEDSPVAGASFDLDDVRLTTG